MARVAALLITLAGHVPRVRGFAGLTATSTNRAAIFAVKDAAKNIMYIHAYAGRTSILGVDKGEWKALSVGFTGGDIDTVEMPGAPFKAQFSQTFFQAADLSGRTDATVPNGLAAIVTFKPGTNMAKIAIDYSSKNTYIVQKEDNSCMTLPGRIPCATLPAIFFNKGDPPAVVVFSPSPTTSHAFDVWTFSTGDTIQQVSIGFNHQIVESWHITPALKHLMITIGRDAFGIWRSDGGEVPTATKLATIAAPADACVVKCLDIDHHNSNVEAESKMHDVVYIQVKDAGALVPTTPCDTCTYVDGGGDAAACQPTKSGTCAAHGVACYESAPACACDGVGSDGAPDPKLAQIAGSCKPPEAAAAADKKGGGTAEQCMAFTFPCWLGKASCLPTTKPCFVPV